MVELLRTIDAFVWLADALVFAIFFVFLLKEMKLSSTFISLGVVILLDGMSNQYLQMLRDVDNPAYIEPVRLAWYGGLTAFHYVTITTTHRLHLMTKTPYSFITKMVFLEYYSYGIMHMIRYVERTVFQTDYLQEIYQSGILSINLSTTAILIVFTISVALSKYRMAQGHKGLAWRV